MNTPSPHKVFPWPSMEDKEIEGIGKVKIASILRKDNFDFNSINKELVSVSLKKNRVVIIIGGNDEVLARIQPILGSEGAEVLSE